MNTTTEIAAGACKAPAPSPKATPKKRRMAREGGNPASTGTTGASDSPEAAATPTPAISKIASVIGLLEREQGATLAEMVEATGWLPHTTRAALTGLKKKGHTVTSTKTDGVRTYRRVQANGGLVTALAEIDSKVNA